jgi:hypothetical protein
MMADRVSFVVPAIKDAAQHHAANVLPIIREIPCAGATSRLPTPSMPVGSQRLGADGGTLRP